MTNSPSGTRQQFMDSWLLRPEDWARASHLPILDTACKFLNVRTVLEFGLGVFSTNLFLERYCDLCSLETSSEWYVRGIIWYGSHPNRPRIQLIHKMWDAVVPWKMFDLLFVDGDPEQRKTALRLFGSQARIVVLHDTENFEGLGFEEQYLQDKPYGYRFVPSNSVFPSTDIYVRYALSNEALNHLKTGESVLPQTYPATIFSRFLPTSPREMAPL